MIGVGEGMDAMSGRGSGTLAALAFECSPVATIYTEDRVVKHGNAAFAEMFELPAERLFGLAMELFYPAIVESERVAGNAGRALRATGRHADERVMRRQGGSLFWCAVTGRALQRQDPFAQTVWCFQDLSRQWNIGALRPRDRDVAMLVCAGHTAKHIGHMLNLSPRTVEAYLARIKATLSVRNVAELVSRLRPAFPHGAEFQTRMRASVLATTSSAVTPGAHSTS
ncbi:helix-turn-helix transcriptional regulator [Sphingomonas colocasiae]|uniref:Helix-turn-helix transcriptional regulator n=1 Tax=Sphingomonas colocasiae TaxID=1848973 RepID=A0ABS7PS94_9SPHN|nr:helix-turn-helix transcriptional regulator [Sphingomonas colocasiae]MBY8824195.1 helix-turn-helix transcriptional regulator [Sphingomonas colocasiae]